MKKTVTLGPRPTTKPENPEPAPDAWVERREEPEPMKRLTFDVPEGLHRAIKTSTAARGKKMNEEIVAMLEERYRGKPAAT